MKEAAVQQAEDKIADLQAELKRIRDEADSKDTDAATAKASLSQEKQHLEGLSAQLQARLEEMRLEHEDEVSRLQQAGAEHAKSRDVALQAQRAEHEENLMN